MPRCKGFLASVRVNGKALEEYAVDTKDDLATSWIASEEGQVFDVVWEVEEPGLLSSYAANLEVEGIPISRRTHNSDARQCSHIWRGKRINGSEVRPFQFARVNLIDDESQLLRTPTPINLTRSIVIRICRVKAKKNGHVTGPAVDPDFKEDGRDLDVKVEMLEKDKVLNPHTISFGHETIKSKHFFSNASYKRLDSKDRPFFTFKFLYGPKELLRAQGMVPHENERGQIDSSESMNGIKEGSVTLRDLECRMAEADRQRAELQNEMDRIRGAGDTVIKSETNPEIAFNPGEVIDLTDV